MLKLTEQEIIRFLEAGKDLPEKENEWQSFRTKKDRSLELKSAAMECGTGKHKVAIKVVDIFSNGTMTIVEASV